MATDLWHWYRSGWIGALELHLARLLGRLCGALSSEATLAVCAVARLTAEGHSCADLASLAGTAPLAEAPGAPRAPALAAWREALRACPAVGEPGQYRPLILDGAGRLYLHRYWSYEQRVARRLAALAAARPALDRAALPALLDRLFPPAAPGADPGQRVAAALAAARRLCVISGGPGTGKTTTVVRIIALLGALRPGLRVALAAPTGKAAARLEEAVRAGRAALALDPAMRAALPERAATLHRLLGVRPGQPRPRHHAGRPLVHDLVVVDEASMIDLELMARLLDALPEEGRLVLLGDRDQLASVAPGAVLGDLCAPARGPAGRWREELAALAGCPLPEPGPAAGGSARPGGALPGRAGGRRAAPGSAPPERSPPPRARPGLGECVALLEASHRFGPQSGIGRLARAVRDGDPDRVVALLRAADPGELAWRPEVEREALIERLAAGYRPLLEAARGGAPAAEVLARLERLRALCAHRQGALGVAALAGTLERRLAPRGGRDPWYPGRAVMVVRNDPVLELYNGDVGVAVAGLGAGGLGVCFALPGGAARILSPARLPAHESALVTTVHKAQGGEFDEVVVVLPERPSPVLTRELLYTAATRARRRLELWGSEAVVRAAVSARVVRASGLREALWGSGR